MIRFARQTWVWIARIWRKVVVDRLRYRLASGYRAEEYWRDRFRRHGDSLRGPGHEGMSDDQNAELYAAARVQLETALRGSGDLHPGTRVLEIGPGTGVWTSMCADAGVGAYHAIDITSERFESLRARYPGYRFEQGDAAAGVPAGPFDLVLCLDVIEHLVEPVQLQQMLRRLQGALAPGGSLALSYPPWKAGRVNLFYLRFWPEETVREALRGLKLEGSEPFRVGILQRYRNVND